MKKFKTRVVAVAAVAALSALGLFLVRGELADTRASVAAAQASRDRTWNNYLLSEQRASAAAVLVAARDPLGTAEAVAHMRGAFVAIATATDEEVPKDAFDLLGADGPVHRSPFALDLANHRVDAYNVLKERIAPLQHRTVKKIGAYRAEIAGLERRIGLLTHLETAAFLLTVLCALLLNVVGAARDSER